MAAQTLVEQAVLFVSSTGEFDENAIFANSLVQSLAQNSAAHAITGSYKTYQIWNSTTGVWTPTLTYELVCFVPTTFQATIQSNIPALQAAFPQYTILTHGHQETFGN